MTNLKAIERLDIPRSTVEKANEIGCWVRQLEHDVAAGVSMSVDEDVMMAIRLSALSYVVVYNINAKFLSEYISQNHPSEEELQKFLPFAHMFSVQQSSSLISMQMMNTTFLLTSDSNPCNDGSDNINWPYVVDAVQEVLHEVYLSLSRSILYDEFTVPFVAEDVMRDVLSVLIWDLFVDSYVGVELAEDLMCLIKTLDLEISIIPEHGYRSFHLFHQFIELTRICTNRHNCLKQPNKFMLDEASSPFLDSFKVNRISRIK